jgi:predicted DsbA family dithiol-disulfide isomerase
VSTENVAVQFYFDPVCPWAWLTSRWMLEVEQVRPVNVSWHVMSLAILNESKDISEEYRERVKNSIGPSRLCVAAEQQHGTEFVLPLYTALGSYIHQRRRERDQAMYEAALSDAGLPVALAELAQSEKYDDLVRASHERAMAGVGDDVGTPVLVTERFSIFGPVVSPHPTGERAGLFWDAVSYVSGTDGFFELKRTRNARPIIDRLPD